MPCIQTASVFRLSSEKTGNGHDKEQVGTEECRNGDKPEH